MTSRPSVARSRRRFAALPILTALIAFLPQASCAAAPLPRGDGPSLVLLISIDQMRSDYLDRFRDAFSGGLAWIADNGAIFTDAHQNHSMTATAPGHATLSTGLEPARSGIVGNVWFDRDSEEMEYSAGPSGGRSPVNLEGTGFGDWLKQADSRSKSFTASGKDRSAIMLGGQRPDAAYWYDRESGQWTTSSYYERTERPWVTAFHSQRLVERYFGIPWEPLTEQEAWSDFAVVDLDDGVWEFGFPHVLGGFSPVPDEGFYSDVYSSPWVDWYLGRFARALIENEQLGMDGSIDYLGLSFSALDTVGHSFGPHSPEVLDVLRRLDGLLGGLLRFIDESVGLEHVLVVLSSDHGVMPFPEYQETTGREGRRLGAEEVTCIQRASTRLRQRFGEDRWILRGFYLDEETIATRGLDKAEVERELAAAVQECAAVERAWTGTELGADSASDDPIEQRFRSNYFPGRSPDVTLQLKPYYLYYRGVGTTHGSVYDYDSHVPVVFAGPGIGAGRIDERVATVDVPTTLASLLGIRFPDGLDGRDLSGLLPRPAW